MSPAGGGAVTPTTLDPSPERLWRAARAPVLVGVVVLLAALLIALLRSGSAAGTLDPRAVDRTGSRALAQLLRGQGVDVTLTTTTAGTVAAVAGDAAASTVLVAVPDRLAPEQLQALRDSGADLVLVDPGDRALAELAPSVLASGATGRGDLAAGCALPAAERAGAVQLRGNAFARAPGSDALLCYPGRDGAGLAVARVGTRQVSVLGAARPLTNEHLDSGGSAALALGLLGSNPRLVWYLPSLSDLGAAAQRPLAELVPRWVAPVLAQLGVAVVLFALWRGRRLGPVVTESLPVVVRASEAAEGRARLYRRARARGSAAAALREAVIQRVAAALALGRPVEPAVLVAAVAARTGRAPDTVAALLYGAAPARDEALVGLADALDALETEVRRP